MARYRHVSLPGSRPRRQPLRLRQRGSVLVATAGALLVSVTLLASADLGYLFYMKREFQKVADLAALAGAQRLDKRNCAAATADALGNANANLQRLSYSLSASTTPAPVTCGRWDPAMDPSRTTVASEDAPRENYPGVGVRSFFGTPAGSVDYNAVKVNFSQTVPTFFGFMGSRVINVQAIAMRDAPVATFSVGSTLATVNPGNSALGGLLKVVGVNLDGTSLAGYQGLAQARITPSGLLEALGIPVSADLGVGELNNLLAARKVELGSVLNAIATLGGQNNLLSSNIALVNALRTSLGVDSLMVQLGSSSTAGGLFALINAPGSTASSALNAQVNALDLVNAAVGVASSGRGVTLDAGIPNIAGLTTSVKLGIVEPPSVGIGGIGTKAYTAQVRLYSHTTTTGAGLLSNLLSMLGTTIDLPVVVDVVNARGTLTDMNCAASTPQATINVDSSLLKACMGRVDPSSIFSTRDVCETNLGEQTFARVLNINLLSGKVNSNALSSPPVAVTVPVGQTRSTGQNPLNIGTTLKSLTDQLLGLILAQPSSSGSGGQVRDRLSEADATQVADRYIARYGYDTNKIAAAMAADGVSWPRPCVLGLTSCSMPEVWKSQTALLCDNACKRSRLVASLQTAAANGLLNSLLGGVGDLLTGLLGGNSNAKPQNLLQSLLVPVFELLRPVLDGVGLALSKTLQNLLGIDLGVTDVKLSALSCNHSRLVY